MKPSSTSATVARADVEAAAERIAGEIVRTPATWSQTLSEILGASVVVKFENLQFTGSFKERGALNRLLHHPPTGDAGVIAASAGNHAQGLAYHAGRLGIPVTIVMPETTPFVKVARTRRLGATCVLAGADVHDAEKRAREIAAADDMTLVHPYDDVDVIAGQGTVALELLEQDPEIEIVVVPVGGGGLVAGIGAALLGTGVAVVGVEADRYASFTRSPALGTGATVADGIAVKRPGALTKALIEAHGTSVIAVPESAIEAAITYYLEVEKTVAEGAGAASLAALLHAPDRFSGRRVGVILSGGNIDPHLLAVVAIRGLASQGRLWRVDLVVDDHPGVLGEVVTRLATTGVNVIDVTHERLSAPGARQVSLGFVIDAFDEAHALEARALLESAGFAAGLAPASERC